MKNLMGKSRGSDAPYLTFETPDGGWQWKVLKSYQGNDRQDFARWFCDVSSPFVDSEIGDVYVTEIVENAVLVQWDRELLGEDLERLTVPVRLI